MDQPGIPELTLSEKVGQVIMAVPGADPDRLDALVAEGRVGGVLLPAGLAHSPAELAAAVNRLQRLAPHPLLFAADLDANPASFLPGASSLPGSLALAAARRMDLARRVGELVGREARAMGVHLVLGPVLDVPAGAGSPLAPRCLGDNALLVSRLGAAMVIGCQAAGALAVGRRFPGCGSALYDPARELSYLPQDRVALDKIDLPPFVTAIRAGLACVQSAPVHVAALDNLPNRLATHSSAVLQGLLRGSLGFTGLLLSDNLDSPPMRARYQPGPAAVLALAAGHDLLLTESPEEVHQTLCEVLDNRDVPPARLDEAVARVWAAKARLGLVHERQVPEPQWDAAPGRALAQEVALAALTAIRGEPYPVGGSDLLLVAPRVRRPDGSIVSTDLRRLAAQYLPQARIHELPAQPGTAEIDALLDAAGPAEAALAFLDQTVGDAGDGVVMVARALRRAGLRLGAVLLGSPNVLGQLPEAEWLVHVGGNGDACLEAALAYLLGQVEAPGRLPVTIQGVEGKWN